MELYRVCSSKQFENFQLDRKIPLSAGNERINTLNYEKGIIYIHFFKYAESAAIYAKEVYCSYFRDAFIIKCDISQDIIDNSLFGYGSYIINDEGVWLEEYAIPFDLFDLTFITDSAKNSIKEEWYNIESFYNYIKSLGQENRKTKGRPINPFTVDYVIKRYFKEKVKELKID